MKTKNIFPLAGIAAAMAAVTFGFAWQATVQAQVVPSTSSVSAVAVPIVVSASSSPAPVSGYLQFDNLTVTNVSSNDVPGVIMATAYPLSPASTSVATSISYDGPCYDFGSADSPVGTSVTCPALPNVITISVGADAGLLLRGRSPAVLANVTPGDVINVYGLYDGMGNIQASVIRDLSKPAVGSAPTTGWQNEITSMFTASGTVNGTVVGVNDDGSLNVQFDDGQTIIVPSIIPVGTMLTFGSGNTNSGNPTLQVGILLPQVSSSAASPSGTGGPMIPYNPSSTPITVVPETSTTGTIY